MCIRDWLMVLQKELKRQWSFSGLATMVRITLMYYVDFYSLFNNPEKEWEIILSEAFGAPPQPSLFDWRVLIKSKRRLEHRKISVRAILFCTIWVLSDSNNFKLTCPHCNDSVNIYYHPESLNEIIENDIMAKCWNCHQSFSMSNGITDFKPDWLTGQ